MLHNGINFKNILAEKGARKKFNPLDLIYFGAEDKKFAEGYRPAAMTAEDFKKSITEDLGLAQIDAAIAALTLAVSAAAPSYRVYTAFLSQVGVGNPTAVVKENTLGYSLSWLIDGLGNFKTSNAEFTNANKPKIAFDMAPTVSGHGYMFFDDFSNSIYIQIRDAAQTGFQNAGLTDTFVEIRIYN